MTTVDAGVEDLLRITLNQAVAVAMVDGPRAGLDLLAVLDDDESLADNHRLAAVRAHLLESVGDRDAARDAVRRTTSLPEQRYLEGRAARLAPVTLEVSLWNRRRQTP